MAAGITLYRLPEGSPACGDTGAPCLREARLDVNVGEKKPGQAWTRSLLSLAGEE